MVKYILKKNRIWLPLLVIATVNNAVLSMGNTIMTPEQAVRHQLKIAIIARDESKIKEIVENPMFNINDDLPGSSWTALHWACYWVQPKENNTIVPYLLSKKANPACLDNSKQTALHLAAGTGNTEVVRLLVEAGANVNAKDKYDITPLYVAAQSSPDDAVITYLLANGAQPSLNIPALGTHTAKDFIMSRSDSEAKALVRSLSS
jgi:ankyrin repeat protein